MAFPNSTDTDLAPVPLSEEEMAACSTALGVMSAQIAHTSKQTEEAVARVGETFKRIVRRTKENAASISKALGDAQGTDKNVKEDPLTTARTTIRRLLERMDSTRTETSNNVRRIESIVEHVSRIQIELNDVDHVVYTLKVLAINAQVEAARSSRTNAAFAVVASETVQTAESMKGIATSIRQMVQKLHTEVQDSTRMIRETLARDSQQSERDQAAGVQAVNSLKEAHERMGALVSSSVETCRSLGEDVYEAMNALQFQDAVSQQLEHVRETIETIHGRFESTENSHLTEDWEESLRSRYTMHSERALLDQQLGIESSTEDSAAGSIELF